MDDNYIPFGTSGIGKYVVGYPSPPDENALLAQLPGNDIPGVFPRDVLPPVSGSSMRRDRSSRAVRRPPDFIILWSALWVYAGFAINDPVGLAIFLSPTTIWSVVLLLQWRHRVHALTDQRVIRIAGAR